MLRVEKVGAHAAFWENLWAKVGPNRAIMLDYQLTVLLVRVVRRTFSENSEPVAIMRRTPEDTRGAP